MATRISPPQNKTYYINPAYLTFVENSGYGANLIQVSASSSCYISVYDPANGIGYSDADRNYKRWKVTAYNNKFPDDNPLQRGEWYIYVRLERNSSSALVIYDQVLRGVKGGVVTVSKDESGNDVYTEAEPTQDTYWFIRIGNVGATDGTSIRSIVYDTGYLLSDESINDKGTLNEMWELDKFSTPWLIKAKQWLTSFKLKGILTFIGGRRKNIEKPVTDIRRSVDSSDPDDELYVPVDDTTLPTTAWVESRTDNRFLKKYEPDETRHRIKFFDGIECGEFVTGMVGGSGTQFDGDGYGEMNGLTLREFLEVPELRFNRIDVVSGELWNSVAFGLVESVDPVNRICTLKLEEKERAGLEVNDICRGIFADFGDGEKWEGVDECGFLHLYGFWTSYFTPTQIIEDNEGSFRFKYKLREGTQRHPVASMKFAVYGNFDDNKPERQASAYSTRTYKRYLNGVNTWVINPNENIYAQYGNLDGLTVGGFTMSGYGSFQSNSYFTGVQIQFTPEQKEELRGEDSYSAVLSDYVGVVRMSSDGTVVAGEYVPFNVVSGEENVITEQQNVVTHDYLLRTQIQAFRGSTELVYSDVMDDDCFIATINPVGCVATIENGVVCVTEVTSMEYSYVKIAVNCEGNASFELTYQIKLVKDGESAIYADIDNEMDAVACDKNGKVLFGLPVSCKAYMYAGTTALELEDITVSSPEGVVAEAVVSDDGVTGVVKVTEIAETAGRVLPVNVYLTATHNSMRHIRMLTFTVSKQMQGENGVIYKMVPSSTALKADRDHSSEYMPVSCFVTKHDGVEVSNMESLPQGYSMTWQKGGGKEETYSYGSQVEVHPEEKEVVFRLYFGTELIDVETVPVLLDGNTAFKSTVFLRSNDEPRVPSGGSYSDPKPDSEPVWFDYIPRGEETLWASTRIFSIDGLYPQEDTWSQPSAMTDTASLDVEFSSVQINPGNPTDNPDNWSNEGSTDTWWMATRVIRNGEPGEWSISQIKGEKGENGAPGEDGKDGADGADAEDYIIEASVTSLGFTMTGGYSPSSFIVSEYHRKGSSKVASNKYYMFIYGCKGEVKDYLTTTGSVQNYTFNTDPYDDERYDSFIFELRELYYETSDLVSSTTVSVSKEGKDGKDGAMPRYCGLWRDDVAYEYNDEYRDIVIYKGQVYQVLAHGTITTSLPTSTTYWEQANKFSFVAMDTALVDNANIAGFVFKNTVLQSQTGSLVLDGNNGRITAGDGTIKMRILPSESQSALPGILWEDASRTYTWLGVHMINGYMAGQLTLTNINSYSALISPGYIKMSGTIGYNCEINLTNSSGPTFSLRKITSGVSYSAGFGMDSSGYIRIGGKWYDDSKKVNVGELWVDDDGYIKLRKS